MHCSLLADYVILLFCLGATPPPRSLRASSIRIPPACYLLSCVDDVDLFSVFAKIRLLKSTCPPLKNNKLPSHQVFGVFALEVNKILQTTPSKLRREMGKCATTIYVQQQQQYYKILVLVVRTPVSSLSFQVQHTWYIRPGRHAHEPDTSSASCCCNGSVG